MSKLVRNLLLEYCSYYQENELSDCCKAFFFFFYLEVEKAKVDSIGTQEQCQLEVKKNNHMGYTLLDSSSKGK